jgi:hypothetical protein
MAGRTSQCRIQRGATNIVVHWRFSEDVCKVARSEVSPRTRKRGIRGRVVEIGAIRSSCDPCAALVLKSVFEVVLGAAPVLSRG